MTDKIYNHSQREIENGLVEVSSVRAKHSMKELKELIKEAAVAVAGQVYYSLSVANASKRFAEASKDSVANAIGKSIKLQEQQKKLDGINKAVMYVMIPLSFVVGGASMAQGHTGIGGHALDFLGKGFKATTDGLKIPIVKAIAMYEAELKKIEQESHLLTSSSSSLAEHMREGFEGQMEWVRALKDLLRTMQDLNVLRQIA